MTRRRCLKKKNPPNPWNFLITFAGSCYVYKLVENVPLLPPLSVMGTQAEVWSSSTARGCLVLLGGLVIHPRGCSRVQLKVTFSLPASKISNNFAVNLARVSESDNFFRQRKLIFLFFHAKALQCPHYSHFNFWDDQGMFVKIICFSLCCLYLTFYRLDWSGNFHSIVFGSLTGSHPNLQSASTEIMGHIPASCEMSAENPVLDVWR